MLSLLIVLVLMLVIELVTHQLLSTSTITSTSMNNYLTLDATIASGRYMSRLLPWNSAFSLTVNRERSTRSHRVNFQIVFVASALLRRARGEADPPFAKRAKVERVLFSGRGEDRMRKFRHSFVLQSATP